MKRLAALLTVFTTLFVLVSGASAKTTYTVRKGDNLHVIAKKFHVSVKDLEKANKVGARNLRPGAKISIPVKGISSGAAEASRRDRTADAGRNPEQNRAEDAATVDPALHETAGENTVKSAKKTSETKIFHTVRKGDTLRSIAIKYGVSESDIKGLNEMSSNRLKTGRKLLVKVSGPKTYTVRKGDNLWRVAKKFDMDADDLMEMNEMSSPDLRVGQKLYLEEKPEAVNVDQKYIVMAKNLEEELKKVSESPEFAEKNSQDKLSIFARKLLNIPYKFGGNTILGIDCSAYVKKVYGLMGVNLPRTAREQFKEGEEIGKDELSIGDLVFFRTYASFPSHVGIYLGNNLFIHASSKGKKVTIDSLDAPYYLKRFIGGKRLISSSDNPEKVSSEPAI